VQKTRDEKIEALCGLIPEADKIILIHYLDEEEGDVVAAAEFYAQRKYFTTSSSLSFNHFALTLSFLTSITQQILGEGVVKRLPQDPDELSDQVSSTPPSSRKKKKKKKKKTTS